MTELDNAHKIEALNDGTLYDKGLKAKADEVGSRLPTTGEIAEGFLRALQEATNGGFIIPFVTDAVIARAGSITGARLRGEAVEWNDWTVEAHTQEEQNVATD